MSQQTVRSPQALKVLPLTCALGAHISGVQLSQAAQDGGLFDELHALLLEHKVLFLRDQVLTRAEHVAFASRFGSLEDHPVAGSDPEHPGLVRIYKSPDQPADRYENAWHSDASWRENRPWAACCVASNAHRWAVTPCGPIWHWPTTNCPPM